MKATHKLAFARIMLLMLCFLLVGTTFTPPSLVEASSKIATLTDIKGDVFIKKGGGKREVKASNNMGVTQGDTIRTGKKAYAKVVFDSKNATSLGENTTITVAKLAEKNGVSTTKVKQTSGKVWNKVSKSSYEVETPTSIMGVRGTMFLTQFDNNRTTLRVLDGIVAADRARRADPSSRDERLVHPYEQFEQVRGDIPSTNPMRDSDLQDIARNLDSPLLTDMLDDLIAETMEKLAESEENLDRYDQSQAFEDLLRAIELSQGAENLDEFIEMMLRQVENHGRNDVVDSIQERIAQRSQSIEDLERIRERAEEARRQALERAGERDELQREREQLLSERQQALRQQLDPLRNEQRQQEQTPTQPEPSDSGGDSGGSPPTPPVTPPVGECGEVECKPIELTSTETGTRLISFSWEPYDIENFAEYRIYLHDEYIATIDRNELDDTNFMIEGLEPDTLYMFKVAAYAEGAQYPEAIAVLEARTEMEYGTVSGTVYSFCPPFECNPSGRLDPVSEATVRIKIDGDVWEQKEITDADNGQFEFFNVPVNKDFTVEATFAAWTYGGEVTIASDLQRLEPNGEITVELIFDIFEHIGFVEGSLSLCEYGDWACDNSSSPTDGTVQVTILNEAEDVVEETGVYYGEYYTELPIGNNYQIGISYLSEQYQAYKLGNDIVVAVSQRFLDWEAFFEAIFENQFYSLFPKDARAEYTFNIEQGENELPLIVMNPYQLGKLTGLEEDVSSETITVGWDSYEDATRYYCILEGDSTRTEIVDNVSSCTFNNLEQDTEYRITVVAVTSPVPDMILPVAVDSITVKTQ